MGRVTTYSLFFSTQGNSKKEVGPLPRCITLMYQSFIKKTYSDALILRHGKAEIFKFTKAILQKADKEQIQDIITKNLVAAELWKDEYVDLFIEPRQEIFKQQQISSQDINDLKAEIKELKEQITSLSNRFAKQYLSKDAVVNMLGLTNDSFRILRNEDLTFPKAIYITNSKYLFETKDINEWIESHKKNQEGQAK